jgi:hypothetical protein
MTQTQKQFREYLIENIRVNRTISNQLIDNNWDELGYSSEEEMETHYGRCIGALNALEDTLENFDNIENTKD